MQHSDINYKERFEQTEQTIAQLKHELVVLKKIIFGGRHEKFASTEASAQQLSLAIEPASSITNAQRISYIRTKVNPEPDPHPSRNKLPEHLRREEIIIEPVSISEKKKMGQLETEV